MWTFRRSEHSRVFAEDFTAIPLLSNAYRSHYYRRSVRWIKQNFILRACDVGVHKFPDTKFCTSAATVCRSSVWNLLRVTFLVPGILWRVLLEFVYPWRNVIWNFLCRSIRARWKSASAVNIEGRRWVTQWSHFRHPGTGGGQWEGLLSKESGVACPTPFVELPVRLQTFRRLRVSYCPQLVFYRVYVLKTWHAGCGVTQQTRRTAAVVLGAGRRRIS